MPIVDLPDDEEMATAVARIDAWAARELAAEGPLVAAERQEVTDRTASFQWYLRFKGEEKDFITVWLTLKQRTLWHEAQFMPAPEEHKEEVFAYLLRRNMALFGMAFEPYDPITTAAHVIKDPLFGQPAKTILMWYAEGDALVSNITTELVAREMGISMIGPPLADHQPWHVPIATGPLVNGIVQLNDHPTPLPPTTNVPAVISDNRFCRINCWPVELLPSTLVLMAENGASSTLADGAEIELVVSSIT